MLKNPAKRHTFVCTNILSVNIEDFREYCLTKKGVIECFPFDETTLVFKVLDKMFALTNLDGDFSFTIKVDPEKGIHMRELFPCVLPAYHMNKKHWITVYVDSSVNDQLLKAWIDDSYTLVVAGFKNTQKEELHSK